MLLRYFFFLFILVTASCSIKKPQEKPILLKPLKISTKKKLFRENPPKLIDIIHTDLNVSFDWAKHKCIGEEKITLTPYYYTLDSFTLEAKNFKFKSITLLQNNQSVPFSKKYDGKTLWILLDHKITRSDTLIMDIKYVAYPDKNTGSGSAAIQDDKGLYFINTDGIEPYKPMQLWTQGETEANSNWFVTIDKPFEKMTFDIHITVPDSMTTLSNGLLIQSLSHSNGLRTDSWSVKQPMSAYLVMMAIGKFNKTNDKTWRGQEVSYYLEDNYHQYAKKNFQHTPEMLDFFSNKLNYPYPWQKYAQVVVRDFVSGAMENTSATVHGDFVQKNHRELLDHQNDGIIAHELFHQWFGDLVTCASWSHLTLNEGFATFGEQLWFGYKYGEKAELKRIYKSMQSYLKYAKRNDKPIIRFYYNDKEDLFNPITYQKGARVLNLLKFTVGEEAFFSAITNYLKKYAFRTAQIENLRHEFEETSGKDLRYFFRQWFLRGGHPKVNIELQEASGNKTLSIKQIQQDSLFSFPFQYKINNTIKSVVCSRKTTTISIPSEVRFIYPDPNGIFIGEMSNKTYSKEQLIPYFKNASNYIEKIRILEAIPSKKERTAEQENLLLVALNDSDPDISHSAMKKINWENEINLDLAKEDLKRIATFSTHSNQKSQAIYILGAMNDKLLTKDFINWTQDSSYQIAGAALHALERTNPQKVLEVANILEKDAEDRLFTELATVYAKHADSTCNYFSNQLMKRFGSERNHLLTSYGIWAKKQNTQQQNEFWEIAMDRAQKDQNKWTRLYAMLALNKLAQKSESISASQKSNLIETLKNEKDGSIRRQLQIYKLLPIESLEK